MDDYNSQKDFIIKDKNKLTYKKKDILKYLQDVIDKTCKEIKTNDRYEIELDFEDKNNIIQNDFFVINRVFGNESMDNGGIEKAFSLTLCNNDENSFKRLEKELQNELTTYINKKKNKE